jgi:hypothetical protein
MSFTFRGKKGLQYDLGKRLERCGIRSKPDTTGVWEGTAVSAEEAAKEFQKVFELLGGSAGGARGQLNHLWIYIDQAVEKKVSTPVVFKRLPYQASREGSSTVKLSRRPLTQRL